MTRLALCTALLVAVAGCRSAAPPAPVAPDAVTVFLVRHVIGA